MAENLKYSVEEGILTRAKWQKKIEKKGGRRIVVVGQVAEHFKYRIVVVGQVAEHFKYSVDEELLAAKWQKI